MVSNLEDGYQATLVYLGIEDDICGLNVFATYQGGLQGANYPVWWQAVVDFLYRNLQSGLIDLAPNSENKAKISIDEVCRDFAEKNPKKNNDLLWLGVRFQSTPKLLAILDKHALDSWSDVDEVANKLFLLDIKNIYSESDVPWDTSEYYKIDL
jgi:hypothetical protein